MINLGIQKKIRCKLLRGKNVYCPCCDKHFSTFLPAGKPVRFNVCCPSCNSFERHRLLWLFLFNSGRNIISNGIKLLHIAPESVFFKKFLTIKGLEYCPADKFMPGYSYPKGTKNLDVTNISYPDNYFDAILCNHVLEHVPNDTIAMRELYRTLKPGGCAILQVPIDYNRQNTFEDQSITSPEEREKYFGQYDHLRLYGCDYAQRLEKAGFRVSKIDFFNSLSEQEKKKFALDPNDGIIYFCTKS